MHFFIKRNRDLEIRRKSIVGLPYYLFFVLILWCLCFNASPVYAQEENKAQNAELALPVQEKISQDSLAVLALFQDSIANLTPNPAITFQKSSIDTTIFYSAKDSIYLDMESKIMNLYGDAKVTYGKIKLDADDIQINQARSTLHAQGKPDSLGHIIGSPIFWEGKQKYKTHDITYNFKSKRAKISEVVSEQGDGLVYGNLVFKSEYDELYTLGNAYTTCKSHHPHFRIVSKKAKMMPNDKIVTGPFYMELNDVPMPIGFPFGMFPINQNNTSGIIFPTYGEETNRGFFIKGMGYYFDISDYLKIRITGDLYSKGSGGAQMRANYSKRYKYTGSVNFNYTNNKQSLNIEDLGKSIDYQLNWNHSPQTRKTSRFSASVSVATNSYTTNNRLDLNSDLNSSLTDNTTRKLSSNISYSKSFPGTPFMLGINMSHNQDLKTEQIDLTLPNLTFNMNNVYPFKKISDNEFLEKLSVNYTMAGKNQITNNLGRIKTDSPLDSIAPFSLENIPVFFDNAILGMQHTIPIQSSLKLLNHFIISASFRYSEKWYKEKLDWKINEEGNAVVTLPDTIPGFNRVWNYSSTVGFNTRIYGTFISRNPNSRIRAIRHIINPTVGYTYVPDFGRSEFDFFQNLTVKRIDSQGRETLEVVKKSRHSGLGYGSSRQGESSSLSFSIGNSLEMKVRNPKDSVVKKVSILNSLSISSSYNFAADSLGMAPFQLRANTNILSNKINIRVDATLDPYQYYKPIGEDGIESTQEIRVNRFAWENGFDLGRITRFNLAFSTNLSAKGRKKDNEVREDITDAQLSEQDKAFLLNYPYVSFEIPWNLRINYNLNYTPSVNKDDEFTQAIKLNGDFSLTPKWKITFRTGYDFKKNDFTQTQIGIQRDLHCWTLSGSWVPFGRYTSFSFTIQVKSSILKDLKYEFKNPRRQF